MKKKAVLDANGLRAYTFGVAGTSIDRPKTGSCSVRQGHGNFPIIVEPGDFAIFDNLEEPRRSSTSGWPSTTTASAACMEIRWWSGPSSNIATRIGVCMDAGWITSTGMKPAAVFRDYQGRVFDIHQGQEGREDPGR